MSEMKGICNANPIHLNKKIKFRVEIKGQYLFYHSCPHLLRLFHVPSSSHSLLDVP